MDKKKKRDSTFCSKSPRGGGRGGIGRAHGGICHCSYKVSVSKGEHVVVGEGDGGGLCSWIAGSDGTDDMQVMLAGGG